MQCLIRNLGSRRSREEILLGEGEAYEIMDKHCIPSASVNLICTSLHQLGVVFLNGHISALSPILDMQDCFQEIMCVCNAMIKSLSSMRGNWMGGISSQRNCAMFTIPWNGRPEGDRITRHICVVGDPLERGLPRLCEVFTELSEFSQPLRATEVGLPISKPGWHNLKLPGFRFVRVRHILDWKKLAKARSRRRS